MKWWPQTDAESGAGGTSSADGLVGIGAVARGFNASIFVVCGLVIVAAVWISRLGIRPPATAT